MEATMPDPPFIAYVACQSWAGLTFSKVEVLKVNPKRSRVHHLEGGYARIGSVGLVPNGAIRKNAKRGSPSAIADVSHPQDDIEIIDGGGNIIARVNALAGVPTKAIVSTGRPRPRQTSSHPDGEDNGG